MTLANIFAACRRVWARFPAASESGASLVEYGLLLALIAVVCVGAVTAIGLTTQSTLTSSASLLK